MVIALLRKLTNRSISEIKVSVERKTAIYEGPLFPRDARGFARDLAKTMEAVEKAGGEVRAYLVPQEQTKRERSEWTQLGAQVLRNMADASDAELVRQRDLAFSEADDE
jgi:osmotically-inducible protein OsmY